VRSSPSVDFSSVVSFFPFRESADGSSASCTFGLRRPGLCFTASPVVVAEDDDGTGDDPAAGGVDVLEPSLLLNIATSSAVSGGFQSGQFLASFESSGTSTISLSLLTEINQA
jgi:hypothetical protein